MYRTVDYYYKAYAIERQYYQMMDFDVKLDVRANLEEISRNLDLFYWIHTEGVCHNRRPLSCLIRHSITAQVN